LHEHEGLEYESEVEAFLSSITSRELLWQELWKWINNLSNFISESEAVKLKLMFFLPGMDLLRVLSYILIASERPE